MVFFLTSFSLSYFSSQQHSVVLRAGQGMDAAAGASAGADAENSDESGEAADATTTQQVAQPPSDDALHQGDADAPAAKTPRDPEAPADTPLGVPSGHTP